MKFLLATGLNITAYDLIKNTMQERTSAQFRKNDFLKIKLIKFKGGRTSILIGIPIWLELMANLNL